MGPLPRDLDEYPEALAVVDELADIFDSVRVQRRDTPLIDWLITGYDEGKVAAMVIVDEHGAIRAAC